MNTMKGQVRQLLNPMWLRMGNAHGADGKLFLSRSGPARNWPKGWEAGDVFIVLGEYARAGERSLKWWNVLMPDGQAVIIHSTLLRQHSLNILNA